MITIRQAETRDLPEIMRLHRQVSKSHRRLDPRLGPGFADMEKFRKALQPVLGGRSYPGFVAQEDDSERLSGCIIGRVVENRPFAVPEYGYIACLYVDQGRTVQEIGLRLFTTLRERFKAEGLEAAQVEVPYRNPSARRFWEERGFTYFLDHLYRDTGLEVTGVPGTDVVVRPAGVRDMEAVLSLWEEMMDYHAPLDRRLTVLPRGRVCMAQAMEYWLGDDTSSLLVAEAGDGVIGFALGGLADTGLGLKADAYGHIAHMCVAARWRRRGVGRQLFGSLRDWFGRRRLSSIHIYVSHFSPVSQRFWRRLGFESYIERLWCDL